MTDSNTEKKIACITLDLEPDCGGRMLSFDSLAHVDSLLQLFKEIDIPLTVFVTGKIFEEKPEIVRRFCALRSFEIGVHAYTHRLGLTDRSEEIQRGIAAYYSFFKQRPLGYRAPQGCIDESDLALLLKEGVQYDSSIFPSWRPRKFNHIGSPNVPHIHQSGVVEIPITVFKPLPIPFGLGYARLLGKGLFSSLVKNFPLPSVVVMAFHLHDIFQTAHVEQLKGVPAWFYRKNVLQGAELLKMSAKTLKDRGYSFVCMRDVFYATMDRKNEG